VVLKPIARLAAGPSSFSARFGLVLVGDSLTVIEAAHAAGVAAIGYANKTWKVDAFASADIVVTSMSEITQALSPMSPCTHYLRE
jgi:phosphoglycolate phosphatase-like HAD superfamily hydrolase